MQDCIEVASILKAKYARKEFLDRKLSEIVLDKISEDIDDEFLTKRGRQLRAFAHNDEDILGLLESLYKDCCATSKCEQCAISKYCNHYINKCIENFDPKAPTIVDLFCGAGGLSLGFVQEGFKISLANDIEACCIDTYSHNHPETPRKHIVQGDINQVIENIQELLRFHEVDCVVGGPPCQGFSMANRQRLIDDPRNSLYKSYVKVVSIVNPKFFIMENVKGMQSVAHQVIEDFERIGYDVDCMVFNAKDFGVPQNRERLIYIGNRIGLSSTAILREISKSAKEYKEHVLADALFGLRALLAMRINNATEMDSEESGGKIERDGLKRENDSKSKARLELINYEIAGLESKARGLEDKWREDKQGLANFTILKDKLDKAKSEVEIAKREGKLERAGELQYSIIPELEKIICTPLMELGEIASYWSGCYCNRQKCESCWMQKNLWDAK